MTEKKNKFSKNERVKTKKEISRVIHDGIFLFSVHIKLAFIENTESQFNKLAVSVPKRLFKSAVKRNKIKRQMREVFRLNKEILNDLSNQTHKHYDLMIIYKSAEMIPFQVLKEELILLLNKMCNRIYS